jgi:hypothetical protein
LWRTPRQDDSVSWDSLVSRGAQPRLSPSYPVPKLLKLFKLLGQFLKKEASRKGAIGILNVITHTRPLPHNDLEKAALMAQV